ncbi:MAG TPA: hypothetical protein VE783_10200 [Candidatus Limnocylindrales bacterium]|nr:hypothetical protein [Candidatus Limnocylindrales bacterium]
MNKIRLWVGFLFFIAVGSAAAQRQKQPPALLQDAVYCATTDHGGWLNPQLHKDKKVRVSFTIDRKSYEGKEHLVLVFNQSDSSAQAFDIIVTRSNHALNLHMVNNAGFKRISREFEWNYPPLGGVWTQEHFEQNIRNANSSGTYLIDPALSGKVKGVSCSSYARVK